MSGNQGSTAGGAAPPSPHQDRLSGFCREQNVRTPNYQVISDRRGGRTAWSCVVTVQGANFPARFWYDGQYVNNAREDAAEKALQTLGVISSPPPRPANLQQQPQQQSQQPQHHQHQYRQTNHFYGGAINS